MLLLTLLLVPSHPLCLCEGYDRLNCDLVETASNYFYSSDYTQDEQACHRWALSLCVASVTHPLPFVHLSFSNIIFIASTSFWWCLFYSRTCPDCSPWVRLPHLDTYRVDMYINTASYIGSSFQTHIGSICAMFLSACPSAPAGHPTHIQQRRWWMNGPLLDKTTGGTCPCTANFLPTGYY